MIKVCPLPDTWHRVYKKLVEFHQAQGTLFDDSPPPRLLILNGWAFTNDHEKKARWEETIAWIKSNDCEQLISDIQEHEFYFVESLSRKDGTELLMCNQKQDYSDDSSDPTK